MIKELVNSEVLDSSRLSEELRATNTPYLIVNENKEFSEDITQYGFIYVKTIDGYDIYLDEYSYIGL